MNDTSYSHEAIDWVKQRLDELDAIIQEVEKSVVEQNDAARAEVEKALERLKSARLAFQNQYDTLRADANELKKKMKSAQDALDEEWIAVETSFQTLLAAIADQADSVRSLVVVRADAQRRSWEASLMDFRARATETLDRSRQEFDAAARRLSEEAEKFQARIGNAKDTSDESWAAVKEGLAEAKAVQDRTTEKIRTSISKLF
jgi:chromosome segregation ATPase